MKEKTTKYIKSVLRHIKAGDKTKERIKFDLETEFENKMESGLTIDEIIAEKGSAKSVADEFNMAYRDSSVKKNYRTQKLLAICGAIFILLSFPSFLWIAQYFLPNESTTVGIIGGADGPTQILVAASPDQFIITYTVLGSLFLLLGIVSIVLYFIWKKQK